jgi:hypothetical protein
MAKGKKSGGKNFKKGKSGNEKGRPLLPEDLRKIRTLYKNEHMACLLTKAINYTQEELLEILSDPKQKCIDMMIGKIVLKGVVEGDPKYLSFILDRVIGRVKEHKEVKLVEPFIVKGINGEKIELGTKEKDNENG